jgi:Tfp pilus assembly protein PilF
MTNASTEPAASDETSPASFEARTRAALESQPGNPQTLHELGLEARRLGSAEKALELFSRASDIDSENPLYYVSMARLLAGETMFNQAALAYLHAQQLAPQDASILRELIDVLKQLGRNDEAELVLGRLSALEGRGADGPDKLEAP